jgi:hypothetical protein
VRSPRVTRPVTLAPMAASMAGDGEVLTTAQAARLLQVSPDTLLAMPVPFVRIGGGRKRPRRRYLRSTLLEWLKRREAPSELLQRRRLA